MSSAVPSFPARGSARYVMRKLPHVTLLFWVLKTLAVTLGETAGDLLGITLKIGYVTTALIFLVDRDTMKGANAAVRHHAEPRPVRGPRLLRGRLRCRDSCDQDDSSDAVRPRSDHVPSHERADGMPYHYRAVNLEIVHHAEPRVGESSAASPPRRRLCRSGFEAACGSWVHVTRGRGRMPHLWGSSVGGFV